MADFEVKPKVLRSEASAMKGIGSTIKSCNGRLSYVASDIGGMNGGAYGVIASSLRAISDNMITLKDTTDKMQDVLDGTSINYTNTEKKIASSYSPSSHVFESSDTSGADAPVGSEGEKDKKTAGANVAEQIDEFMDCVNTYMKNFESKYDELVQAVQDAVKWNGVVAIGISGSIGAGAYLGGSVQLVVDLKGNLGFQFSGGAGVEAGESADGTIYAAVYPGMESIYGTEGFGTEVGGSFGEGIIGSAGLLSSGEGNDMELAGGYIGIGVGGEGTIAEGHVSMTQTPFTIPLGNIFTNDIDKIMNTWDMTYSVWKKIYQ